MNACQPTLLTLALIFGTSTNALAERIDTSSEVAERLDDEGFDDIRVLEFDGLLWHAEAVDSNGQSVAVRINPASGEINTSTMHEVLTAPAAVTLRVPQPLDELEFRKLLVDAGYHDIHDVEYDGGIWRAEAVDALGEDFEIRVDAGSGRVVHIEDD